MIQGAHVSSMDGWVGGKSRVGEKRGRGGAGPGANNTPTLTTTHTHAHMKKQQMAIADTVTVEYLHLFSTGGFGLRVAQLARIARLPSH